MAIRYTGSSGKTIEVIRMVLEQKKAREAELRRESQRQQQADQQFIRSAATQGVVVTNPNDPAGVAAAFQAKQVADENRRLQAQADKEGSTREEASLGAALSETNTPPAPVGPNADKNAVALLRANEAGAVSNAVVDSVAASRPDALRRAFVAAEAVRESRKRQRLETLTDRRVTAVGQLSDKITDTLAGAFAAGTIDPDDQGREVDDPDRIADLFVALAAQQGQAISRPHAERLAIASIDAAILGVPSARKDVTGPQAQAADQAAAERIAIRQVERAQFDPTFLAQMQKSRYLDKNGRATGRLKRDAQDLAEGRAYMSLVGQSRGLFIVNHVGEKDVAKSKERERALVSLDDQWPGLVDFYNDTAEDIANDVFEPIPFISRDTYTTIQRGGALTEGLLSPAGAKYLNGSLLISGYLLKAVQGSRPSDFDFRLYLSLLPDLQDVGTARGNAKMEFLGGLISDQIAAELSPEERARVTARAKSLQAKLPPLNASDRKFKATMFDIESKIQNGVPTDEQLSEMKFAEDTWRRENKERREKINSLVPGGADGSRAIKPTTQKDLDEMDRVMKSIGVR